MFMCVFVFMTVEAQKIDEVIQHNLLLGIRSKSVSTGQARQRTTRVGVARWA